MCVDLLSGLSGYCCSLHLPLYSHTLFLRKCYISFRIRRMLTSAWNLSTLWSFRQSPSAITTISGIPFCNCSAISLLDILLAFWFYYRATQMQNMYIAPYILSPGFRVSVTSQCMFYRNRWMDPATLGLSGTLSKSLNLADFFCFFFRYGISKQ